MKKILVIAVLAGITIVWAESTTATYFSAGFSLPTIDQLNARLKNFDYSELDKQLVSYGFGFYGEVGKGVIIGFEWSRSRSGEKTSTDGTVSEKLENSMWFINIGGMVLNLPMLRVFPYVGVGAGTMTLILKDISLPSFDEIISGPAGVTRLETGGLLVNPSVAVEFKLGTHYILGVHGGYVYDPSPGDWKIEDTQISDGPDAGITGPWANIVFGLGN